MTVAELIQALHGLPQDAEAWTGGSQLTILPTPGSWPGVGDSVTVGAVPMSVLASSGRLADQNTDVVGKVAQHPGRQSPEM